MIRLDNFKNHYDEEDLLRKLEEARDKIKYINDITGVTKIVEGVKVEIKQFGWTYIINKYHPDNNIQGLASHEIFDFYKCIYEYMKKNGEI